jgi:hypothetical protein
MKKDEVCVATDACAHGLVRVGTVNTFIGGGEPSHTVLSGTCLLCGAPWRAPDWFAQKYGLRFRPGEVVLLRDYPEFVGGE